MRDLDEQEAKIIRELIRNPRISDNNLSKRANVPVMTVNRKRKKLEEDGILNYFTDICRADNLIYKARQLYIIKLKSGITRSMYLKGLVADPRHRTFNSKHHAESYLGEKDGHLAVIMILEANTEDELVEIFNGEIIKNIKKRYGQDCVQEIVTCRLNFPIRLHHNYIPSLNIENGKMKENWLNEWIFVNEESFGEDQQKALNGFEKIK